MNITVPKKDLLRLVGRCQGVVDKKSTMPVLANVLMSVEAPDQIRIAATDLYLAISGDIKAHVDQAGSTAVHARDLFERIKAMPEGPINILVNENGSTEVKSCTLPRKYRLQSLPVDSFPALPEPAQDAVKRQLEVDVLARLINQTQFSISSDETRAHLNSAFLEWEGDIVRMVTTDGHRLTKAEAQVDSKSPPTTMLIPLKAIAELRKLADEVKGTEGRADEPTMVTIVQSGPNAFFQFDTTKFSVKLVDAQFPAYGQVIPRTSERVLRAPRVALMEALRAVSLAADDRTGSVKVSIDTSTMKINSESPESGDGFDEIPIDYEGSPLTIGFNAKYLLDILNVLEDEEVQILLSGELDPAVIKPASNADDEAFLGVVMPMRV